MWFRQAGSIVLWGAFNMCPRASTLLSAHPYAFPVSVVLHTCVGGWAIGVGITPCRPIIRIGWWRPVVSAASSSSSCWGLATSALPASGSPTGSARPLLAPADGGHSCLLGGVTFRCHGEGVDGLDGCCRIRLFEGVEHLVCVGDGVGEVLLRLQAHVGHLRPDLPG